LGGERLIGRERSRGIMEFEGSREVGGGLAQDLSGDGRGHGHLVGKPSHGVGVDNLVGAPIDAGVASKSGPTYQPSMPDGAQVAHWLGFWCMTTCVPRGAMGGAL